MIDNDETQKKLKMLSAITEIHQSIGANLALEKIGQILVEKLTKITNCDGCAILMIDDNKVKILSECGFMAFFKSFQFSVDMPAIKYIIDTKKAIFTGDIAGNQMMTKCIPPGCNINSLLCAPIIVKEEVKGIIHLDSKEKNAFDEENLQFAESLATQASIAFERSFLYEQVKALSVRDALTGCFNRRKLEEDLENEIYKCKRYKRQLSILMVDFDGLKKYNDFHGHLKGDELLKKIASVFLKNTRIVDRAYRYGGDEFILLLPETDKASALEFAERLRRIIEQEEFEGEMESQPNKKVTISIGVATFPLDADSKKGLVEFADSALYRAKQAGNNRVYAFNK